MACPAHFPNVVIFLCFAVTAMASYTFVTDEDLVAARNSTGRLVIATVYSKDISSQIEEGLKILGKAASELEEFDVKIHFLNCEASKSEVCDHSSKLESVRLYRDGDHVVDLDVSSVASLPDVKEQILGHVKPKHLTKINAAEEWDKTMQTCAGVKNIVFFYIPTLSSKLFQYAMKASMWYQDKIQFAYSTESTVVAELFSSTDHNSKGGVWLSMCAEEPPSHECLSVSYPHRISEKSLNRTLHSLLSPSMTVLKAEDPTQALQLVHEQAVEDGYDVIVLVAAKGKMEKTRKIARKACGLTMGKARCVIIDGSSLTSGEINHLKPGRIHLSVLAFEGHHEDIEAGHLAAESELEIYMHWERLVALREMQELAAETPTSDDLLEENVYEPITNPNDVQDDPVAFAVHHDKAIQDMCLVDRKIMTRLTDVTYEDVITGKEYAVILFTLEFNVKSLAVFTTFVQIQQQLKDQGRPLPLYRVECFDWPDVCDKAGFITYPQMMIYGGGKGKPVQYDDIWSEERMRKTIIMHSVTWPVVVQSEDELRGYPGVDAIYGLALTQEGEEIFRAAASKMKEEFAFFIARDSATKAIASSVNADVEGSNILAASSKDLFLKPPGRFSSLNDIIAFVTSSFAKKPVEELTIYNFHEVTSSSKPLFIQFKNVSDSSPRSDEHLYDVITAVQGGYNEQARFMWMDGSPKGPGSYVLYMHSGENPHHTSMSYLNPNGEVSFKSFFPIITELEMRLWIDDCLAGKSPVSFTKIDMDWKPRLPGHDYLRYMKDQGMLPEKRTLGDNKASSDDESKRPNVVDEQDKPKPITMAHSEL